VEAGGNRGPACSEIWRPDDETVCARYWCHRPCSPARPDVLMRRRFSSAAMAVIDMPSPASCSMSGRKFSANAFASAACLSDCSFVPPSFTPLAFARARPSFVRMEIMRRSFSANAA
jgi:hypothetical protein